MIRKTPILLLIILAVAAAFYLWQREKIVAAKSEPNAKDEFFGERIVYDIKPAGTAEYNDLGLVDLWGKKMKLATFRTQVLTFDDTETIYSDPETLLPIRVERDISMWPIKERIVEDYDPRSCTLVIKKIKKKASQEQIFKAGGPIHNAVILPFYLRSIPEFNIGWSMQIRLPQEFKVELAAVEDIEVPAGKFKAYHFTSKPHKFDIWVSMDKLRLPVKIKGAGGLGYTMLLKERSLKK